MGCVAVAGKYDITTDKFTAVCAKFGGRVDVDSGGRAICVLNTRVGETRITFTDRKEYADNYYVEISHSMQPHFSHAVHGYFKYCAINRLNDNEAVIVCRGLDTGESNEDHEPSPVYEPGYFEIRITKDDVNYLATANAVGMVDSK